jgi:PAS domain-containing protein
MRNKLRQFNRNKHLTSFKHKAESLYNWLRCKFVTEEATPSLDKLILNITDLHNIATEIKAELKQERQAWEQKIKYQEAMFNTTIETIPDMVWLKGVDGKYIYANQAIRDGLLFDNSPIGKDDAYLSQNAKRRFGEENHTFGEVCGNSDKVVIETLQSGRFLEDGKVKGKMMYLEVHKSPVFIDGVLIGVCGTGRDMTEYVEAYRFHGCNGCDKAENIFQRYQYKNPEEVQNG